MLVLDINLINLILTDIEKYLQMQAKTRAIQVGIEKKLMAKINEARQAMK